MNRIVVASFLVLLGLLASSLSHGANRWGTTASKCEGEVTVFYSRIHVPSGSWEAACQTTEFVTQAGPIVRFASSSRDARKKNHQCTGSGCDCRGPECANLVSMKCVHRGWDGMWGEVRLRGAHCAAKAQPAASWGEFVKESCATATADKYYARLNNAGPDWLQSCRETPAFLTPHLKLQYSSGAQRWECQGRGCDLLDGDRKVSGTCVNKQLGGMWLEAFVDNPGCPAHWGEFTRTCPEVGRARYEARLWDVPAGSSWEQACLDTPADYLGKGYAVPLLPEHCRKDGVLGLGATGIWARVEQNDATCVKRSFTDLERSNHCLATLPDIQRIWTPRLQQLQAQQANREVSLRPGVVNGAVAQNDSGAATVNTTVKRLWHRRDGVETALEMPKLPVYPASLGDRALAPGTSDVDSLVYTVGGGVAAGAFFGAAAEFGIAARTDGTEYARGYVTVGHTAGLQAGATAEGSVGWWVVKDPSELAGDGWGCSIGASTGTGVSGVLTAWYDYENNYVGATLGVGGSVGLTPVEAVQSKVYTLVF